MQPMRCVKLGRRREKDEKKMLGFEGILRAENWGFRKMLTELHLKEGEDL